jgi:YggT family protein
MRSLLIGIDIGLEIYCWILVAVAALQLCSGFGMIDIRNPRIAVISAWLERATAFSLRPVRKILPDLGAVDISPIVLILILMVLRYAIALYAIPTA